MAYFVPADDATKSLPDIQKNLPILPLQNAVAFSFSVLPLEVVLSRSVKLVEDAYQANRMIGLVGVKDPSIEEPDRLF